MAFNDQSEQEPSALINLKEFQEKWCELLDFEHLQKKDVDLVDEIAERSSLPQQTVNDLSGVCSLKTLLSGDEAEDKKLYYERIPNTELKTLQYHKKELLKRKENQLYRSFVFRHMKYNVHDTIQNPPSIDNIERDKHVLIPNILMTVDIHRPSVRKKTFLSRDQCVLVRGDMFLSEFRDSIECVNDLAIGGDFSENLKMADHAIPCKETMKSGFLYIEGTFYNDTRWADNRDYSRSIIDWMKNSCKSTVDYKTASMENVRFNDLSIKLGEPYLYMHQGNCEHTFNFCDVRMLTSDDSRNIDDYPFVLSQKVRRRVLCKSCWTYTARWQIEESKLTPAEPCYLCDGCLQCLHYDKDGNKVGHFKAFKFADTFSERNKVD